MRIVAILFLFVRLSAEAQEIKVTSAKDENVDFRQYTTYFWAAQVDHQTDDDSFFLGDLLLKADIRDAIHIAFDSRGYRLQEVDPDLIVNFRVFNQATTLNGLHDYGRNYWRDEEFFSTTGMLDEIKVDAGTLIISIVDRENRKLVWQAFASGLLEGIDFTKDENKLREAVALLFEAYGTRVNNYSKR